MHDFYHAIEQVIGDILDQGDDDELFASGYLSGHLSVALAKCEEQELEAKQDFISEMSKSLQQAYHAKELAPPDQALVEQMWLRLQSAGEQ
ncbi:YfcL family protein [Motilimonas pumila]|uniref:YfcL family protein n=1 Tax=Motilimonas pumila TaxID=2303987 RepID=A0A418YET5_9GAMM|nr:YfcL family protein [Motilimonas pumila]RJG47707.1 YfcL family protein [Motilimonas pumila]